jgi:hypothetical protein
MSVEHRMSVVVNGLRVLLLLVRMYVVRRGCQWRVITQPHGKIASLQFSSY